jgi:hypothetical protein
MTDRLATCSHALHHQTFPSVLRTTWAVKYNGYLLCVRLSANASSDLGTLAPRSKREAPSSPIMLDPRIKREAIGLDPVHICNCRLYCLFLEGSANDEVMACTPKNNGGESLCQARHYWGLVSPYCERCIQPKIPRNQRWPCKHLKSSTCSSPLFLIVFATASFVVGSYAWCSKGQMVLCILFSKGMERSRSLFLFSHLLNDFK